jgi:hypothetical protein
MWAGKIAINSVARVDRMLLNGFSQSTTPARIAIFAIKEPNDFFAVISGYTRSMPSGATSNASRKNGYSSLKIGTIRFAFPCPSVFGLWTINRLRSQFTSDHFKPVNSEGQRNPPYRARAN